MASPGFCHKCFQRKHMGGGKVGDMNIVAHPRAIGRIEIGAENGDALALTQRRLHRDLDEVGGAGGGLADAPLRVRARDVEIAQRAEVHGMRSEEHTSELHSLMRISYAGLCLKKKKHKG